MGQGPDCRLIVCSLKAAGVGLTLTAASDVAFVEFGWTPGDMDQAEDRAHRIGQRDSVTAWYLMAPGETIDTDMMTLIASKRDSASRLLDGAKAGSTDDKNVRDGMVKAILARAKATGKLRGITKP